MSIYFCGFSYFHNPNYGRKYITDKIHEACVGRDVNGTERERDREREREREKERVILLRG